MKNQMPCSIIERTSMICLHTLTGRGDLELAHDLFLRGLDFEYRCLISLFKKVCFTQFCLSTSGFLALCKADMFVLVLKSVIPFASDPLSQSKYQKRMAKGIENLGIKKKEFNTPQKFSLSRI